MSQNITHFYPCNNFQNISIFVEKINAQFSYSLNEKGSKNVEASVTQGGLNVTIYSQNGKVNNGLL